MTKKYAVLGLIIALVVSIAAIGCSSGSNEPKATPTKTPAHTAAPTAEPTEEPEEVGELPANYQFFMEWSDSDGNSGEMQYWVKGEKWNTAWSMTDTGTETETEMMIIYDGQFTYLYLAAEDPSMDQVLKYKPSEAMINPGAAFAQDFEDSYWGEVSDATIFAGFQAACAGGASIDGQEDVNGVSCTKFTCNFEGGGVSYYWIADSGWLMKVETTLDGKTTTMQYSNIIFNADIPDSRFDINAMAPGVPITDMTGY
jgi:outer membrane lipoprotein-sorting protein